MQPAVPKIAMPGYSTLQMKSPLFNVTLNPTIFEEFIKSQGIRMVHSRPVPCPNVKEVNSAGHSPSCNLCYNGFIYYNEKEFTGAFFGNQLERMFNAQGTWDIDNAYIIVPVFDKEGNILDVQYFDQIIVPDFTVRYYQRIEHSQSGHDRLHFPAISIDFVIDNSGKKYMPGVDVIVEEGRLHWLTQNRPSYNIALRRGAIYSVNYYTRPVFTVLHLPHHLRAAQTQSGVGEANFEARFPQLCVVRKDFIPFEAFDKKGAPDSPEPKDASFV